MTHLFISHLKSLKTLSSLEFALNSLFYEIARAASKSWKKIKISSVWMDVCLSFLCLLLNYTYYTI